MQYHACKFLKNYLICPSQSTFKEVYSCINKQLGLLALSDYLKNMRRLFQQNGKFVRLISTYFQEMENRFQ